MKNDRGFAVLWALLGVTLALCTALTTDQIMQKVYDSSNTALRVNVVAGGAGGSGTVSSGTVNTIAKYTGTTTVGNSGVTDDGTVVTTTERVNIGAATTANDALSRGASATTNVIPKLSSGRTVDSSITDNGTTVSTSEALSVGALTYSGALTAPPPVAVSSSGNIASTTQAESCTSGASAITRTLPAATGSGRTIGLAKIDSGAGTCIFGRTGADTLNGATTKTLSTQYQIEFCRDWASALWLCDGPAS